MESAESRFDREWLNQEDNRKERGYDQQSEERKDRLFVSDALVNPLLSLRSFNLGEEFSYQAGDPRFNSAAENVADGDYFAVTVNGVERESTYRFNNGFDQFGFIVRFPNGSDVLDATPGHILYQHTTERLESGADYYVALILEDSFSYGIVATLEGYGVTDYEIYDRVGLFFLDGTCSVELVV